MVCLHVRYADACQVSPLAAKALLCQRSQKKCFEKNANASQVSSNPAFCKPKACSSVMRTTYTRRCFNPSPVAGHTVLRIFCGRLRALVGPVLACAEAASPCDGETRRVRRGEPACDGAEAIRVQSSDPCRPSSERPALPRFGAPTTCPEICAATCAPRTPRGHSGPRVSAGARDCRKLAGTRGVRLADTSSESEFRAVVPELSRIPPVLVDSRWTSASPGIA